MRSIRLYIEQPLAVGALLRLEERPARHALSVLRLTAGDPVVLFNGDGRDYDAVLEGARREDVRVRVVAAGAAESPPLLAVVLGLGISRGERMDYALQKAVELGVTRIAPLNTGRGVVRLERERLERRQQHWQGVLIAACEQSGRRRLPVLEPVYDLADWLAHGQPNALLLDPTAEAALPALFPAWREGGAPAGTVITLLIGAEGGLTPAERALALAQGCTGARLGPRILRTETAPLAAIAAIQALWGDYR